MSNLVECRSDAFYAERPTAVHWQGKRLEVQEVLASWREPWGLRFRVRLEGDQTFELAYDQADDAWDITPL
jgi:hypothetical protein